MILSKLQKKSFFLLWNPKVFPREKKTGFRKEKDRFFSNKRSLWDKNKRLILLGNKRDARSKLFSHSSWFPELFGLAISKVGGNFMKFLLQEILTSWYCCWKFTLRSFFHKAKLRSKFTKYHFSINSFGRNQMNKIYVCQFFHWQKISFAKKF